MNRAKIFIIVILSAVLIIFLGSNISVNAARKQLSEDGTIKLNGENDMVSSGNVYCVALGQDNNEPTTFTRKATIKIQGSKMILEEYSNGTDLEFTETIENNIFSNELATIFYTEGLKSWTASWGRTYSGQQVVMWALWNNCRDSLPKHWRGIIEKCAGNDKELSKTDVDVSLVTEQAAEDDYVVTMHYLESERTGWQNLVLVERTYTTKVDVFKKWSDNDNALGKRPKTITVELLANGEKIGEDGKRLKLSASNIYKDNNNIWKRTFKTLPKYDINGKKIKYTVVEVDSTQEKLEQNMYISTIKDTTREKDEDGENKYPKYVKNGWFRYVITNKLIDAKIKLNLQKVWNDSDNRDGKRPSNINVKILKNGSEYTRLTLNQSNNWYASTEELNRFEDGKEIVWGVIESNDDGSLNNYSVNYNYNRVEEQKLITYNYTITNSHEPELVEIPVQKIWKDNNNKNGKRPTSIKVELYADGTKITDATLTGSSTENAWNYTFKSTDSIKLYKYRNGGTLIKYSVKEVQTEGYDAPEISPSSVVGSTTLGQKTTGKITITNIRYEGYIEIKGKVWFDRDDGKANQVNGLLDDDETGIEGIRVILKDKNGNKFDATSTATTDKSGNYTIKVNYDNSKKVYKLYEDVGTVRTKLNEAYVEFEYDGMTYTTVATGATGANRSKAIENKTKRNAIDSVHSKVEYSTTHPDNWKDTKITATTANVISLGTYADKGNEKRTEVISYCNGNGTNTNTNKDNVWLNPVTYNNTQGHKCTGQGHTLRTYNVDVEVIKNVNLGLFKREQPNIGVFTDISKVEVEMKGQKYTYLYNVRSSELQAEGNLQVKFQNKDTYTYRRPVNPADIAYIQEEANKDAMSVMVTYEVKIGNLSATLPVTVHGISNYYDERYKLLTSEWTEGEATISNNNGGTTVINKATNNKDLNIVLQPQTESEAIELKYEISIEAIRGLLNEEATLNYVVELDSYSTQYGSNTLYAEQEKGGRNNKPYAGYNYEAHPGNVMPENRLFMNNEKRLDVKDRENDTDIAPSFVLCKDEEKILSGNVWEDRDTGSEVGPDNFRVGDGKKEEGDANLENIKVELYRVKEDGTTELGKLYYSDGSAAIDAVTYTDSAGNYSFGNEEYGVVTDKYFVKFTYGEGIEGAPGATKINGVNVSARDYKSTIISDKTEIYKIFKGESSSEEWHLNTPKGYSIAVDDIEERVKVTDLQYSTFGNAIYMTAYSKPFKMQVEFNPSTDKTSQVQEDGKTEFGNNLNIFDFGIIERAREDIYTEKTIEYIKITLANGQVLTEGNPNIDKLNYAKLVGFKQNIDSGLAARNALDRELLIALDVQLMQSAQLDITYTINVTNNSEKEYDYYVGNDSEEFKEENVRTEYYYYGTNNVDKAPIIETSVNCIVDYVDTDLTYSWTSTDWKEKSAKELYDEGLISQKTYETINTGKYKAYINESEKYSKLAPGETTKGNADKATATKLLAGADENVFDNHLEILKIDAKAGRTISGTEESTGTPVIKQYKMGNYVPSLELRKVNENIANESGGLHEQDDDRVKVVISPPEGASNYITTYVIAGLVGLIVITIGIVIIKKKILTK